MEDPGLAELKRKLAEEEHVYAELLARVDAMASNPSPYARDEGLPSLLAALNQACDAAPSAPLAPGGLKGLLHGLARRILGPELSHLKGGLERQRTFNSILVQFLNRWIEAEEARAARFSEFSSAIVGFGQRIDRLADAKDRLYATLSSSRTDLLLDAMDQRLEAARMSLKRADARLEGLTTSVDLARTEIRARSAPPHVSRAATSAPAAAVAPSEYVSFENRFRGSSKDIRERLTSYVPHFRAQAPVVELGCGRGEFLDLLREAEISARGVDDNPEMTALCGERGLEVETENLVDFISRAPAEAYGGIFAAQVIEHLPPPVLRQVLSDCHRALRKGGVLVVETVNPRSVLALVESFYRDLTHQKPLHPDTVDFLLRACGFREVTIEYRSPVAERAKLVPLPVKDDSTHTLNENLRKLNALLFGDQDYAAIAIK